MRPEGKVVPPPARRSWWSTRLATGGVTALAAVSLVGALGGVPAHAQDLGPNAQPASAVLSTDWGSIPTADPDPHHRKPAKDKDKDKGKEKEKPGPPPTVNGCFEIDTVRQEAAGGGAFYGATSGGIAYVGDEETPLGTIRWFDLSDSGGDAPVGACGVSVDVGPTDGSDVVVDVITTSGSVHTIVCERTGSVIDFDTCGPWEEREAPTPGATL